MNQISLFDNEGIRKICDLEKEKTPLISKVKVDEYTNEVQKCFDYDFIGESSFYPFKFPEELKNKEFQILCIVGASGSGKSTFSKHYGQQQNVIWDNTKSIISNFENPNDGVSRLCAVGLNSIPTWCKPRNVLSVGEGFRADLARQIKDNCVIDEYTSTVDRNVAKSCSVSISKYIRRNNIKGCVFVSCHKDFIDFLCPDYVIDLDDQCVYDTRGLLRQRIELSIYETEQKAQIWNLFKQHHYLNHDLNVASNVYVVYWEDELVAFVALMPQPTGAALNIYRFHRIVILPDYQGLGIASKLLNYFGDMYNEMGKIVTITTSHFKLCKYLSASKDWAETYNNTNRKAESIRILRGWKTINRATMGFKYIKNGVEIKKSKYKQDSIFDL